MVTVPDGDDDARQALLSGSSSNPTMMPRGGVPDNNVALLQPHPQTGLVHCLLERRRSGGSSNSGGGGRSSSSFLSLPTTGGNRNGNRVVTLRLEEGAASPETSAGNKAGAVLLQARAVAAHRFAISLPTIRGDNDSKNNNDNNNNSHPTLAPPPPVWATLVRLQSSLSCVTYGLRVHGDGDGDGSDNGDGGVLRAAIVYKVPSVASFLSQKDAPPRRCQMAVLWHDNDNDKDGRSNKSNTNNSNSSSNPHWFEAACRDAIQQSSGGDLSSLANVAGVTLYASREPHRKPNGNMGLNFRGRGRQASPKNMQLTVTTTVTTGSGNDGNNNSGTTNNNNGQQPAVAVVHAQMAKWDTDRYHLDFAMPPKPPGNNHGADSGGGTSMSLLTAFAFGLAQLDL